MIATQHKNISGYKNTEQIKQSICNLWEQIDF